MTIKQSTLSLNDFAYHLPAHLIAQTPVEPRDHSHLLHLDRKLKSLHDQSFFELPKLLKSGDVIVRNQTKVLPARLMGQKPTGGKIEVLLHKPLSPDFKCWECLIKPGLKQPTQISFGASQNQLSGLVTPQPNSLTHVINFDQQADEFWSILTKIGLTPLPHYINHNPKDESVIRQQYQTHFAKHFGSVAAPTAGLHFTPKLDQALINQGIKIVELTLHVGLGTFAPVKTQDITQHQMHTEVFVLPQTTAQIINQAKQENRRIIAVGTTSVRVLESCAHYSDELGQWQVIPQAGETSIYIYPPFNFKIIDGLVTNFHLPKNTLLMLVSALTSAPQTQTNFTSFETSLMGQAYSHAIKENYRFYSFGDAMLIT